MVMSAEIQTLLMRWKRSNRALLVVGTLAMLFALAIAVSSRYLVHALLEYPQARSMSFLRDLGQQHLTTDLERKLDVQLKQTAVVSLGLMEVESWSTVSLFVGGLCWLGLGTLIPALGNRRRLKRLEAMLSSSGGEHEI